MKPLFLLYFIILTLAVDAQNEKEYENFIHFTDSDGLSSNSVLSIERDNAGFIWMGTDDGLNRFDGRRFTNFENSWTDTNAIDFSHILALENDPDGYMWIGSYKGLDRYDYKTNTMERMHHSSINDANHNRVRSIHRIHTGDIWIGTTAGLYIYRKQTKNFFFYPLEKETQIEILTIYQDAENHVWIGSSSGLYVAHGTDAKNIRFEKMGVPDGDYAKVKIWSILEDTHQNLWIGTELSGLLRYDTIANRIEAVNNTELSDLDIRSLVYDKDQNLWIGCFRGPIVLKKNGEIIKPIHQTQDRYKISDGIRALYVGPDGSVWIGGYFGGVRIYNKTLNYFKSMSSISLEKNYDLGLTNTFAEDSDGNIFFGTKRNGVFVVSKDGSTDHPLNKILPDKFSDIIVKSLHIDKHLLWVVSLRKGVFVFDLNTYQFRNDIVSSELQLQLKNSKLYSIAQADSMFAFATFKNGLILYDCRTKKTIHYPFTTEIREKVLGNIRVVFFDTHKNLWIGTTKRLLRMCSPNMADHKMAMDEIPLSAKNTYDAANIITINQHSNGDLLVGTYDRNLYIGSDTETGITKFRKIPIHTKGIQAIVEGKNNILWLTSSLGIVKYETDSGTTELFNENHGLINAEFRNRAFLKASNGLIYFGTTQGVVYFNPDALQPMDDRADIRITDFTIQGVEGTPTYHKNYKIEKDANDKGAITLDHDESSFSISFSDFNYAKILDHSYEYRLVGLHDYWKTTESTSVSFNIQKPGDYFFEVRTKSFSPASGNKTTTIPITVKAAPWKSGYAILGYTLLGALGIVGIYLILRSKTELRHQFELENLKNKKEKERFQSQIEFFTNLSHDFRTPLTLIIAPLNQVIEKYKGSKSVFNKLLTMQRNTDHMLHLINQVLDFHKIETKELHPSFEKHNIITTLHNVYSSFKELASIGNYRYELITPSDQIVLYYDQLMIERVLYNLISNAFKNTKTGGIICIQVTKHEHEVAININDNGKGIDTSFIHKIFDRFFEIANDKNYRASFTSGTGIGLHIAKKTIDLHRGTMNVTSKKNEGSTFTISLQRGVEHLEDIPIDITKSEELADTDYQAISNLPVRELPLDLPVSEPEYREPKPRILVVEDNDELRKFIADILKTDFNVEQAQNGRKGFKKAVQKKINLIISDVIMPEMNGEALCNKIKNDDRTKHIPVVLLTSRTSGLQKISGLESGADAYITKPFKTKEFLLIIRNLLNTHAKAEEKYQHTTWLPTNQTSIDSEDEKLFKNTMKIVYENINNSSFEIDHFCTELGISRYKLFTKIKEWTGQTPKEFVQKVRLEKATQLLEIGDLNVSEVCYEVGFNSPKYFATSFKKQYHLTPTEYASKFDAER